MSIKDVPVSQPDGYAGGTYWSEPKEAQEANAATPEPEATAVGGNSLPRTATGYQIGYMREVKPHPVTGHVGCSGPCCLPELYQPGMPKGGSLGYTPSTESNGLPKDPLCTYDSNVLYTNKALTSSLQSLIRNFEGVIQALQERIEYEQVKNDAYRKVWSAREYLLSIPIKDTSRHWRERTAEERAGVEAYLILNKVLQQFDLERVDGKAIREKYKELK